ncbi:hypothetical protein F4776DRAFT_300858 [Hypoxylon sp. NC0597]|nr:hypothetical protein F4776DRAFT_300858 [Hypoxylon sp. NC0597]
MAHSGSSSRQKNCNACVKSKRRCDKQLPVCGNCTKKGSLCIYGGRVDMRTYSNSAGVPTSVSLVASPPSMSCGDDFMLNDSGFPAAFDTSIGITTSATLEVDSTLESLLDSMAENGFDGTPQRADIPGQGEPMTPMLARKPLSRQDYSKFMAICDDYAPWQLADPSTRIAYGLNVFKSFSTTFARDNSTVYMHRRLYIDDTPRWILQAFSVCVTYENQTPATRGFLLKALHENVNVLKNTASGTSLTPQEKLARVHALVAYQTIRMFDGDISLNQQVDDDMPLLEAWNSELGKIRDNLEEYSELDATELRNRPPESWERWLFAESVRRTYMICASLKTFWDLLKGRRRATELGSWQFVHRWTLSSHLWNATNSFDFFRAWKEKPMWIISAFYFDEFLRTGKGDDVDDFALVFLTMSFGVNEMKMFCYETSGRLLA